MKNKKTNDSYEAAYYMTFGAEVTRVTKRRISTKQQEKYGFRDQWTIHLSNVPQWAIMSWNAGITYADIHEFKKMRLKLKRML